MIEKLLRGITVMRMTMKRKSSTQLLLRKGRSCQTRDGQIKVKPNSKITCSLFKGNDRTIHG